MDDVQRQGRLMELNRDMAETVWGSAQRTASRA
jgi:hypothetical protein